MVRPGPPTGRGTPICATGRGRRERPGHRSAGALARPHGNRASGCPARPSVTRWPSWAGGRGPMTPRRPRYGRRHSGRATWVCRGSRPRWSPRAAEDGSTRGSPTRTAAPAGGVERPRGIPAGRAAGRTRQRAGGRTAWSEGGEPSGTSTTSGHEQGRGHEWGRGHGWGAQVLRAAAALAGTARRGQRGVSGGEGSSTVPASRGSRGPVACGAVRWGEGRTPCAGRGEAPSAGHDRALRRGGDFPGGCRPVGEASA